MESLWWVIKRMRLKTPKLPPFLWFRCFLCVCCHRALLKGSCLRPLWLSPPFTRMQIAALATNWITLSIVLSFTENPAILQISITDCWRLDSASVFHLIQHVIHSESQGMRAQNCFIRARVIWILSVAVIRNWSYADIINVGGEIAALLGCIL